MVTSLFFGACSAKKETSASQGLPVPQVHSMIKGGGDDVRAIPNATIFRMSGDYTDNVAITVNPDGTIAYYPDPSDLSEFSLPYPLGGGWYLNRQGFGHDAVFTSYTFGQYRDLQRPPTHEELLKAVIPGAVITEFKEIPMPVSEALSDPEACEKFIR